MTEPQAESTDLLIRIAKAIELAQPANYKPCDECSDMQCPKQASYLSRRQANAEWRAAIEGVLNGMSKQLKRDNQDGE